MKPVKLLSLTLCSIGIVYSLQSCKKKIYGCTDLNASNFSNVATDDDGSCMYSNISREDISIFVSDFSGSNGYFTTSFQSNSISDDDIVLCEWKASGFTAFEPLPKTFDDLMMVAFTRNGSSITMEVSLYNTSNDLYDQPYFDWFSGSTLRVYSISKRALSRYGIDSENTAAIVELINSTER